MEFNLKEAIPDIQTHNHNCLVRNGITTYEKLADMTDEDLSKLKVLHHLEELIVLRDKAKAYRELKGAEENG